MVAGIVGVTLVAAIQTLAASTDGGLALVKDGKPTCTIVISDGAGYWDDIAAQCVQEYVEKATGAKLPIVTEKDAPQGALISIGQTKLARSAGIRTDDLKYDGCKVIAKGSVLFLIGRDTPSVGRAFTRQSPPDLTTVVGGRNLTGYQLGARGTYRAATKFLEAVVGVRWFLPTSEGERVPKSRDIVVPKDLSISFSPAFAFAHGRYLYGFGPASIANNFRTAVAVKSYGGHSYYDWVPADKYFDAHPEYFALIKGKRTKEGGHLCTSNPEVRELLRKGLFADFEAGFDWVAVGQTDGYRRCECPECEAMDNWRGVQFGGWLTEVDPKLDKQLAELRENPCERLHLAHKWLIDEVARKYPDRKVHLLAYCPTLTPSKKFDHYGDNAIIEVCCDADPRVVPLWKGKAAGLSVYVCWFDETLNHGLDIGVTPADLAAIVRSLHENGTIGFYFGGGGTNWGFMGPSYYVLGRLLGDPAADHAKLLAEYCEGLHEEAGPAMGEFFNLLYTRLTIKRTPGVRFADLQLARYPADHVEKLDALLSAAEAKAQSERARMHVRLTRDSFDYNKLLTQAILAHRAYQADGSPANRQALKAAVGAFDAYRERIMRYDDAYTTKWFPNHGNFCNYFSSEGSGDVYYSDWRKRRDAVLSKPIRGSMIGYGYNRVREPLTLNLGEPAGN